MKKMKNILSELEKVVFLQFHFEGRKAVEMVGKY